MNRQQFRNLSFGSFLRFRESTRLKLLSWIVTFLANDVAAVCVLPTSKEHHVAEEEIKSLLETFWVFDSDGKRMKEYKSPFA